MAFTLHIAGKLAFFEPLHAIRSLCVDPTSMLPWRVVVHSSHDSSRGELASVQPFNRGEGWLCSSLMGSGRFGTLAVWQLGSLAVWQSARISLQFARIFLQFRDLLALPRLFRAESRTFSLVGHHRGGCGRNLRAGEAALRPSSEDLHGDLL